MVRKVVRREALARRFRTIKVQQAFDRYLDHIVDRLAQCGVHNSDVALDVIFQTVTYLSEEGALPLFPTERSRYEETAQWLIVAADMDLVGFIIAKVLELSENMDVMEAVE